MKKKTVIKVCANDLKSRSKALKTVVLVPGVESAKINDGEIEVIGEGVDATELTQALRECFGSTNCCFLGNKLGFAELVSVEEVKKPEPDLDTKEKICQPVPIIWNSGCRPLTIYPTPCTTFYDEHSFCSIM